jgi:prepilin-type N-terminal cleavage/methylation domain-containing protein
MMTRRTGFRKRGGFNLIEVSLAIVVVGLGLIAIFALFPAGLEAIRVASAETSNSLFAERLLNGLHARSAEMNWTEWKENKFNLPGLALDTVTVLDQTAYYLTIGSPTNTPAGLRRKEVLLYTLPWVAPRAPTEEWLKNRGNIYYTELYYRESP